MQHTKIIIASILLFFWGKNSLSGQACCSGGTPLSSNLGLQPFSHGDWQFKLFYDYNTQRDLISGSQELGNNPRERNTHAGLLRASYGISDRIAISMILSMIRQEERIERIGGGESLIRAQGIGDAVAMAQYTLFSRPAWMMLIGIGTKIPWGATNRVNPATGFEVHPDMQPGTGAWDLLGSVHFILHDIIRPSTSLSAAITYRQTTADERFQGGQTYQFGNEWQGSLGLKDQFFLKKWILGPSLLVRYRYTQVDLINGLKSPNTGGHWLFLTPGLDIDLFPGFQVTLAGSFPLYRKLTGTQLTTSYRFRTGIVYNLQSLKLDF